MVVLLLDHTGEQGNYKGLFLLIFTINKCILLTYTSRGHGCGFLTAEFLPIAALLKQIIGLPHPKKVE